MSKKTGMVVMMFERLCLCFRVHVHLSNMTKHGVVFKIEISHNQLNGRHMAIPNPEFFEDSDPIELPDTLNE